MVLPLTYGVGDRGDEVGDAGAAGGDDDAGWEIFLDVQGKRKRNVCRNALFVLLYHITTRSVILLASQ